MSSHYPCPQLLTLGRFDTQNMQPNAPSAPTFSSFNPKAWAEFNRAFKEYARHIASLEKIRPNEPAESGASTSFTLQDIQLSPSGLPLLPEAVRNNRGKETQKIQQGIIRAYLTKHYCEFVTSALIVTFLDERQCWRLAMKATACLLRRSRSRRRNMLAQFNCPAR